MKKLILLGKLKGMNIIDQEDFNRKSAPFVNYLYPNVITEANLDSLNLAP